MKKNFRWLIGFFINYFWVGIAFILISILLDNTIEKQTLTIKTCIALVNSIGISILIASIFTYVSSTSEFVDKITGLLKDIVINRNFLGNIDADSKRNALASLIKPSEAEKQVYANIGRYYDVYIKHTMNISSKTVRSDYSIFAVASFDTAKQKVKCDLLISYRLHPSVNGYQDITINVDDHEAGSETESVCITTPEGKRIFNEKPQSKELDMRGNQIGSAKIPLAELGKGQTHLKVEIKMIEYGRDHWLHETFQALEPTDGFRFRLQCNDGLKIVSQMSFIFGAEFIVDRPSDDVLQFSCDEWLNEGSGLAVVIAKPI